MNQQRHTYEALSSRLSAEKVRGEEIMARAGDSGPLYDSQEADPRSSSFLHHNHTSDSVIEIGQNDLERIHEKDLALALLSDTPLTPVFPLSDAPLAAVSPLLDTPLVADLTSMGLRDSQTSPPCPPKNIQNSKKGLEYFSILAHLAFFGIIGVPIRYGLEILFNDVLPVTHEGTILYKDLPANVVGSFFMGWVGVVLKKDIIQLSEPLAIGLSTGLMGSITTYASWNQKMVALLSTGNVVATLSGLLLGMAIAQMSLLAGIDSARGLKLAMAKLLPKKVDKQSWANFCSGNVILSLTTFTFGVAFLWGAALVLLISGHSSQNLNTLWLACLVAPLGVWTRWQLAQLNGKGMKGRLVWLPVGTLSANLIGASLEAMLALMQLAVTNHSALLVIGGLQLGFLGCLTTVSTFVTEVYTMHVGALRVKAYTYTLLTLGAGLCLTVLIYTLPAWAQGYVKV